MQQIAHLLGERDGPHQVMDRIRLHRSSMSSGIIAILQLAMTVIDCDMCAPHMSPGHTWIVAAGFALPTAPLAAK
jgi:hypothetical protein